MLYAKYARMPFWGSTRMSCGIILRGQKTITWLFRMNTVMVSSFFLIAIVLYVYRCFLSGGSLADALVEARKSGRFFTESQLQNVLIQIAKGLKYIHSQNLVHLDIKPGTVK